MYDICASLQPMATRIIMQMVNCAMVLGDSRVSVVSRECGVCVCVHVHIVGGACKLAN